LSNVHEYVFKGNLDFFQKAEQAEKRLTAQEQAAAKISVENSKQVTASITAEQKIRVQENKAALQKELTDFKTAQREMQASVKQNTFLPSGTGLTGGLMGKSVILGSKEANAMKLKSEFDALSPSIKKASFDAEKFTTSLMGVGFAGVGVVAALEKGLDAYSKQEDALLQLKAATGDSTTEYLNLKNAAEQMQGKWGIADEEIESVQAFLLAQGRSEEQINKTINAGRLLAVVQGTDL
jgi:ATPase subunit of ABC transporter with duplicated ATPase domains